MFCKLLLQSNKNSVVIKKLLISEESNSNKNSKSQKLILGFIKK